MFSRRRSRRRKKKTKWIILFIVIILLIIVAAAAGVILKLRDKQKLEQTITGNFIEETQSSVSETEHANVDKESEEIKGSQENLDNNINNSNDETQNLTEEAQEQPREPFWKKDSYEPVKGIYVTGPIAGSKNSLNELITLLDNTELNTMVIDIKNDDGEITYQMDYDKAQELGACVRYISDIESLMQKLKEHNIYTIARIVCFKDPFLAEGYPELALKKPDGTPVTDAYGLAWVNPYREEVWEYLTDIALQAAAVGFDEIQYDYVRFPIGSDADAADYGVDMTAYPKKDAITGFLKYASEKLKNKEVVVTADVFGTIIGSDIDVEKVGQDYVELAGIVDALCPMVYPSHYGNHVFGLEVPDAQPYETVFEALTDSAEELEIIEEEKRAVVRPWLQAFTATWVNGHISYEGEQIREQIQAVYDAGYQEWILWNASNRYSADGLLPAADKKGSLITKEN